MQTQIVDFDIVKLHKSQNLLKLIAICVTKNLIVWQICLDTENRNTVIKCQNANMKIMANANLEVDIVGSFMKGMEMIFKVRKAMKGWKKKVRKND